MQFAHRCAARQTLLFHHDPSHTDDGLDAMLEDARERWAELGEDPSRLSMASECLSVVCGAAPVAK